MLNQLAAVLEHGQGEAHDTGVKCGGEDITCAREGGGGGGGSGVFPDLEVFETSGIFFEDWKEGLLVKEAENPDAHDG